MGDVSRVRAGDRLQESGGQGQSTGFQELDAHLPGGGWALGELSEVLCLSKQTSEWLLVGPALLQRFSACSGSVVLLNPPHEPFGPIAQVFRTRTRHICQISIDDPANRLWACEQALKCGDVMAVLAWVSFASYAALRRLQMAASKRDVLLWVFRSEDAKGDASPAGLRLAVCQTQKSGLHQLQVQVIKRRGPPVLRPVFLPGVQSSLAEVLLSFPGNSAVSEAVQNRAVNGLHPAWNTAKTSQPWTVQVTRA